MTLRARSWLFLGALGIVAALFAGLLARGVPLQTNVLAMLPATERDPVTLANLLGRAQAAFLRYSSGVQRDAAAPRLERLLVEGMLRSDTQSRRITFLRTFAASAWSRTARAQLKALLAKTLEIPGVALSSRDRFRIIARLLALGDARLTRSGVVVIKAQRHRSLELNRAEAIARLEALVAAAARVSKPRRPTRPSRGAKQRRLDAKTRRGQIKAGRAKVSI